MEVKADILQTMVETKDTRVTIDLPPLDDTKFLLETQVIFDKNKNFSQTML